MCVAHRLLVFNADNVWVQNLSRALGCCGNHGHHRGGSVSLDDDQKRRVATDLGRPLVSFGPIAGLLKRYILPIRNMLFPPK